MAAGAKGSISRFFVWIILILLIVGLAGFGATSFGGSVSSIGQVGRTEIDIDRYAQALQRELRTLEQQTGGRFTLAEAQAFGLDRAVLQQVVAIAALQEESRQLTLSVGDDAVRQEVLAIPAFQGLDGSFDRDAYEYTLEQSGQTIAEFEQSVRADAARAILQGAVVSGIETPDVFLDTLYGYARETRDFTYTHLRPDMLTDEIADPGDADLRAFHDANPDLFTLPERRRITYAWLTPDMIVDDVEVDEDALRALYDERSETYNQPERRLVERLVFNTEDEANAALSAIAEGTTTFDELVAERGLDLADVDLGDLSRADLGEAADGVFALDTPGVAGPLPTPLGPAIFRMNAILAAQSTSFEEAREELQAGFATDAARRQIDDEIGAVDDLLAGGATLEELASDTAMTLGTLDWTPDSTDGIAAYAEFRQAAVTLTEDDFPEVDQLSDGAIYAMRLDEIVPPTLQPFDDVRDAVAVAWRDDATRNALIAQADALQTAVGDGGSLDRGGAPMLSRTDVLRDAFLDDMPLDLVTTVFDMTAGETRVVPGQTAADGVVVVRLDAINAADTTTPEAQTIRRSFAEQTAQGYAQDVIDAFTRAVENKTGIELNQSAINAVHAQFP